ncbi:hypothetical protein RQN30_05225 [Arcanobacterium hippocoleae]
MELADERRTMIFFESPRRLAQTLADMAEAFGAERRAAICRELTKVHEEVIRNRLGALQDWANSGEVRGEIAVVVEGAPGSADNSHSLLTALVPDVLELSRLGLRLKDAAGYVARKHGLRKNELFQAALAAQE